ncbi:nucleotidyltransferase family protein [uncultured Faecalibaculum sp.]|uniref:nucleotidyltransferase family protein n=2 Tax=uncultured Faecalibaculum sp. TaxID=1729681 RepID=UPI0025DA97A7|nr:nucleotidyltransferase family protein [uncultured Faecalibaculum sp.]
MKQSNLKICGIITEYNPFHQGHAHHLRQARELTGCDVLVCILSDYFSQRGLPSVMSWQDKTRLALEHGADLVIRLPSVYAAQSADHFARYALESLSVLGVQEIVFGSECHDRSRLEAMADEAGLRPVNPATSQARNLPDLEPNDILGVQYILQCRRLGIDWSTIPRSPDFISATASRRAFFAGDAVDWQIYMQPEQRWESYYPCLRLSLLMTDPDRLASFFLVSEGIEHRLIQAAREHRDWQGFLEAAVSRTYSRARIQRTCLMILLQVTWSQMRDHDSFYHVLPAGFNAAGQALLRNLDEEARARTAMKFAQLPPFLKLVEIKSAQLYDSVMKAPCSRETIIRKGS